ncbi:MAG: LamG-like jellyroll fold domain-containing protein [Ginsengibacter sp.]
MKKIFLLLNLLWPTLALTTFSQSLSFNGTNNYVNLTNDTTLHLNSFTLEAWIKPGGIGATTSTGSGGITAIPIITKGRGEADTPPNVNMNYFLGMDGSKKLTADFEESSGPNHPIVSKAVILDNVWTHVAASYEAVSAVWKLYINGVLDTTKDLGSNKIPAGVSIQPAAIGSSLNSTSVAAGFFKGEIDEVRIWNIVRSGTEILNNYKAEVSSGSGLVARYGLNDNTGTQAFNSITGINGTLINNPLWTTGQTFVPSTPPPLGFNSTTLSSDWNQAVGLTFNQSGTQMFVWERGGKIWVVENNIKTLFLDISAEVGGYRDLGLLGFALHPQFETNGYFYLFYTVDRHHLLYYGTPSYSATTNEYNNATIGRLTRFTATKTPTGYNVDTLTRKVLIGATKSTGIPVVYEFHHVGGLVFGTDGTLLIGTGDGATSALTDTGSASGTYYAQALNDGIITSQENVGAFRSQLLESYNGKILRIDPETGNGIPSNPFYQTANPGSIRSKVWALGFRNPFRMTLKPGTGSINPADGNPGILYVGDVGYVTWEELDVVNKPGMNFGWPLFEGLTPQTAYGPAKTYNYYAPNPLYGVNGCTQQYFYFKDLIKQETASGTASFTNPCNSSQSIPSTINTFMHSRPIIDWHHDTGPSRTGLFSGETATVANIGATGSPVTGPQFGGSCAIGGVFYTHDDFPAQYKNTYFFGDYANTWIRNITMGANNKPVSVGNAIDSGVIVAMATNPVENGIYYINFTSAIKKITYNTGNQPPVALATSDKKFGPSPLTVQFTGSASSDPGNQMLTYLWNFGDGTTSTLVNPSHNFTTSDNLPTNDTVSLTVRNVEGNTNSTTLIISVNNTPPEVTITSPADSTLYSMTSQSVFNLRSTVIDNEDIDDKLSYQWQTILHHQEHEHPEPIDTARTTTTTISPLGCGTETYYYRIILTVTDTKGLATTKEVRLYPDCTQQQVTSFTLVNAETDKDIQTLSNGTTLNLKSLSTRKLNIRANTNPAIVGSVVFNLSGVQIKNTTDGTAPYSLFGDINGDYTAWTPGTGSYMLKATPYSSSGGSGAAGTVSAINFNIVNKNSTTLQTVKSNLAIEVSNETDHLVYYYPNPFKKQFTLKIKSKWQNNLPVRLYDIYGRVVLVLTDVQLQQTYMLGENLSAGIYILCIGSGNSISRYKFVKIP